MIKEIQGKAAVFMTYSDFQKASDEQIRLILFDCLSAAPEIRRKQLIEAVIAKIALTPGQLADTAPGSVLTSVKSRIGMILSSAMKSRYILEDELGYMSLNAAEVNYVSKYQCRDFVVEALEGGKAYTKQELFRMAEEKFCDCELSGEEKDLQLRSVLGQVIARLEEEAHICRCGDKYSLAHDLRYPSTELGCYLREAALGGSVEKCFLKAVHTMGGEWFEVYAVELLEKYFIKCGKTIISASVSGGSNDGGIDGVINTKDWLGYRELILMQMKNRNSIITPKDVREFYGAVCAEQGSRGLYVTISSFHPEAQKLIDKVDNLIGIDGKRIFQIAKKCRYGLSVKGGKVSIDEALFLKPIAGEGV